MTSRASNPLSTAILKQTAFTGSDQMEPLCFQCQKHPLLSHHNLCMSLSLSLSLSLFYMYSMITISMFWKMLLFGFWENIFVHSWIMIVLNWKLSSLNCNNFDFLYAIFVQTSECECESQRNIAFEYNEEWFGCSNWRGRDRVRI